MAFTQWYLQVDARLIASHVWRLKFLHKDEDDADKEPKVHLRSQEKADGNDSGQDTFHSPAPASAINPPAGPSLMWSRSHLDS